MILKRTLIALREQPEANLTARRNVLDAILAAAFAPANAHVLEVAQ
jgi:hypothetical protein